MSKSSTLKFNKPISHAQAALSLALFGPLFSQLFISEPGVGKSSLLALLAEYFGNKWRKVGDYYPEDKYHYVYVDCPARDFPDFGMYMPNNETESVKFYPNAAIMGDPRPKVIMLDERFKANKVLQPLFTRLDQEKMFGETPLPDGSIVFSTTNNASDGVGDTILAHSVNRVMQYQLGKPRTEDWCEWAFNAGLDPRLIATASMNPRFFESYTDGDSASDNPYIFFPSRSGSFLSPRSLAKCDIIVRNMHIAGEELTRAALSGAVGIASGERIMSCLLLQHDRTPPADIFSDYKSARIPASIGGLYMTIFEALDGIKTQDHMASFLDFMGRTNTVEMESVVFTLLMRSKRLMPMAMRNQRVKDWSQANTDMIAINGAI
jgi:hypothetical protein